ncbi:unnamed protein product [Ectocarpus sp. 8 AP-2014]
MQDKLTAPPEFDGPVRDRKCTDIIFTLAIVIMWVTMTAVGISSVQQGDVRELLAPTDYEGMGIGGFLNSSRLCFTHQRPLNGDAVPPRATTAQHSTALINSSLAALACVL